jgi:hypothetical protein
VPYPLPVRSSGRTPIEGCPSLLWGRRRSSLPIAGGSPAGVGLEVGAADGRGEACPGVFAGEGAAGAGDAGDGSSRVDTSNSTTYHLRR